MKGLELAERFYEDHGRPMIQRSFSGHESRMAVGLVGQGSECFGYDDDISADHDFGPSFCIWLTSEDYRAFGAALQNAYNTLPAEFMGMETRRADMRGGDRIGVLEIGAFYRNQIGRPDADFSLREWLQVPEFRLATVTNGRVFSDPASIFSGIRNKLLGFYPEDVRIKKIAARAVTMGQSGQYNYARSMARAETVAARLALSEFVHGTISMVFLLNGKYAPFYKWAHRAMRELRVLNEVSDLLRELMEAQLQPSLWMHAEPRDMLRSLNRGDRIVDLIETICSMVKAVLQADGLTGCDDDFLATHGEDILRHIQDRDLRSMHVLEG